MDLIWVVFVISAVALTTGSYLYMRAKMTPAGRNEPEATRPTSTPFGTPREPAPRGADRTVPPGTATRRWIYKTDESGRPRRFLSHREAAWWAALKTGKFAGPIMIWMIPATILAAVPGRGTPGLWWMALPILGTLFLLWLMATGTVYLYVALSGGVMNRAERQEYR
jgi:hypothetical protein